jgi:hypothetical protein
VCAYLSIDVVAVAVVGLEGHRHVGMEAHGVVVTAQHRVARLVALCSTPQPTGDTSQ